MTFGMKASVLILLLAAGLPACGSQNQLFYDYAHGEYTVVDATVPRLKIEKLVAYESALHPGKILVAPGRKMRSHIPRQLSPNVWVKAAPDFEPQFRGAALEALRRRGRQDCAIDRYVLVSRKSAIEFEYHCGS